MGFPVSSLVFTALGFFLSFNADCNEILPATANPDNHAGLQVYTGLDAHVHRNRPLYNRHHPGWVHSVCLSTPAPSAWMQPLCDPSGLHHIEHPHQQKLGLWVGINSMYIYWARGCTACAPVLDPNQVRAKLCQNFWPTSWFGNSNYILFLMPGRQLVACLPMGKHTKVNHTNLYCFSYSMYI